MQVLLALRDVFAVADYGCAECAGQSPSELELNRQRAKGSSVFNDDVTSAPAAGGPGDCFVERYASRC
jgi:hypothetical protein